MATIMEIPLSGVPESFAISLAGIEYRLAVRWRDPAPGWVLDIADSSGNAVLSGVPLVTGADLLGQHKHLGIGGALYVQTDGNPDAVPTMANLGTGSHLYFVVS